MPPNFLESQLEMQVLEDIISSALHTSPVTWDDSGVDDIGVTLNKAASMETLDLNPYDYWEALKSEFYILICTDDERYLDLKNKIQSHGKKSQTAIVSTIAVFIGSEIGVEAGVLTPYCALLLSMLVKLGREAFCRV